MSWYGHFAMVTQLADKAGMHDGWDNADMLGQTVIP